MALTPDDEAILRYLHRYRFVQSHDLFRLFPDRSADRLSRRLAHLYRAGMIDRPVSQIDHFRNGGSNPLVYGLATAGARHLTERCNEPAGIGDLGGRNRTYTRDNLDHTLAVSRFCIDAEVACREVGDLTFIAAEEITASVSSAGRYSDAGQWTVVLPWHGSEAVVRVVPDAIFGIARTAGERFLKSYFFLEIDRGSMTIAPSLTARRSPGFLYRSSILRKLLAYGISHRTGAHQERFGIRAARILMLTTSEKRAREMQRVAHELIMPHLAIPPALILFGWPHENHTPLTMPWVDIAGEETTLLSH